MNQDKYIISEFYEFSADKNLIKEAEEKNMPITMTGILQKSNTKNRNGRVYPAQILKREADKYMELVKERRAMGELDHPDSAVVSLSNVSHIVTEMWWEGDTLKGKVEVVNSPSGNILKGLLKSGVKLGISSRGVGSVKSQSDSDVVQEDFELIAFDFVSSPSTPGAYMFKEGRMWGMKRLTDDNTVVLKPEEVATIHKTDKYKKLLDISKEDFWKK
jgi:hypothetical protein